LRHWRRRLGSIPFCRISNCISHSHLYWSYSRRSNNREWNRLDLLTNAFHPSSLFRPETIGGCHHPDSMGAHVYAPLDASAPDDSVTDRGTGSPKKSNASSTKNEEIHPAHLAGILLRLGKSALSLRQRLPLVPRFSAEGIDDVRTKRAGAACDADGREIPVRHALTDPVYVVGAAPGDPSIVPRKCSHRISGDLHKECAGPWAQLMHGFFPTGANRMASQRRSDFRDAACHIIRADETAFSRPILALEERDGELC